MDDTRQAYRDKADARLREWNAKVDQLLARADRAKAEGKIELYERIEDLRARRDLARERLNQLTHSGGEAWDQVKSAMAQALSDLEEAADTLQRRFQEEERLEEARRP